MSHHGMRTTARGAFLLGITGALVGGALGSVVVRSAKPLGLAAIKQGMVIRDNVRARAAELREDVDDLIAQAEHEYRLERRAGPDQTHHEGA